MLKSQKKALKLSRLRERAAVLTAKEDRTDEETAELRQLPNQIAETEKAYRTAVEAEDAAEQRQAPDGEDTEREQLAGRVRLGRYLAFRAAEHPLDGAEAEYNAALEIAGNRVPLAALAGRGEDRPRGDRGELQERAVTPGPTNLPRGSEFIDRVFAGGDAQYLGVMMPSVASGQRVYNLISAGPDAAPKAKAASADATAGAFASTPISPTRIPARYSARVEDFAEDAGTEDALRRDLRGKLTEALDAQIIAGDGSAPNFTGVANLSDPANDSDAITYAAAKALAAGAVDGRYAHSLADLRLLCGAKTFETLSAKAPTNDDSMDALAWWMDKTGGVRVSAHLPAPASGIQRAVLCRMGARTAAYAPIWDSLELIRDPYSGAQEGLVHLTAHLLAGFRVIDAATFTLRDLKLA